MAASFNRRFAALWLPWLSAERLCRRESEFKKSLLVLIEELRGRLILSAVSPPAARAGLHPGMVLADARAAVPGLATRFMNEEADTALLGELAGWCTRYTPWAAPAEGNSVFLDISGCAHLFDGEEALAARILDRLETLGFAGRIAIADTPGAAWAVVHHGEEACAILPSFGQLEDAMAALEALPVAALRIETAMQEALGSFGLRSIGGLFPLARKSLGERFGAALTTRLDQAVGRIDEPISPGQPVPPHEARRGFFEPIAKLEDIEAATVELLDGLCEALAKAGAGARQLRLACHRVDGTVETIEIGTSRPSRWPQPLYRLFSERFDRIDPGFGIEVMVLSAIRVEPLVPYQSSWQSGTSDHQESLAGLIDRLGNRVGFGRIARPVPRQSWLPERCVHFSPPFAASPETVPHTPQWQPGRERPLRLLSHPEPLDVLAPVPDDPPLMFLWHKIPHRVRRADGPERLCGEWWCEGDAEDGLEDDTVRDYYQVEDTDGRRFWLYREGLYAPDKPAKWFLHGVFG